MQHIYPAVNQPLIFFYIALFCTDFHRLQLPEMYFHSKEDATRYRNAGHCHFLGRQQAKGFAWHQLTVLQHWGWSQWESRSPASQRLFWAFRLHQDMRKASSWAFCCIPTLLTLQRATFALQAAVGLGKAIGAGIFMRRTESFCLSQGFQGKTRATLGSMQWKTNFQSSLPRALSEMVLAHGKDKGRGLISAKSSSLCAEK